MKQHIRKGEDDNTARLRTADKHSRRWVGHSDGVDVIELSEPVHTTFATAHTCNISSRVKHYQRHKGRTKLLLPMEPIPHTDR